MKKMFMMAAVVAVFGLCGCSNNAQSNAEAESEEGVEVEVNEVNEAIVNASEAAFARLQAGIESKDPAQIEEAIADLKASLGEYSDAAPEAAEGYLNEVKTWLNDNADKVKEATTVDETLSSSIDEITSISAKDIVNDANSAGNEVIDNVKESAKDAVNDAKDNAKAKADEAVENAKAEVNEATEKAANKAADAVNDAADKALNKLKK